MKKTIALSILLFLVLASTAVFAEDSVLFVKTVPISKVFPHQKGYKVLYVDSKLDLQTIYVPHSWSGTAGKAEVILGTDPAYPYMSVYWKDGEFDHIKLFLNKNFHHRSWGVLNPTEDHAPRFEIETLEFTF